jgi:predicted nucleic acid-binding protein
VAVPEIADYEIRRELLRADRPKGIARLDALAEQVGYLPVTTPVMRLAAELWARVRKAGKPTAKDAALDADVILAATAWLAAQDGLEVIVATDNVRHLGRFVTASLWEAIAPGDAPT